MTKVKILKVYRAALIGCGSMGSYCTDELVGLRGFALKTRWLLLIPLGVLFSFLVLACRTSAPADQLSQTAIESKTLRFFWGGDLSPLWHPAGYHTFSQASIFYLIFNNLVKLDKDLETILPDLAESWEISPDARVFTFQLRQDVKWHDGTLFTAKDVIFSFSRQVLEPYRWVKYMDSIEGTGEYREGKKDHVEGLRQLNDFSVQITLAKPNILFLLDLTEPTCVIVPEHLLKDVKPDGIESSQFATSLPIGTGPYKFVRYLTDQFVELDVNPDYFKGRPQIDRVFMKRLKAEVALAQLESGEVDLALRLNPIDFEQLSRVPDLNVFTPQGIGINTLIFPTERPRVRDRRVRQAIYHAIDRQGIVNAILQGRAKVLRGAPPAMDHYADLNPYSYEPEKARRLLQEAGFDFGRPFRILYDQNMPAASLVYPVIGQLLRQVGIIVQLDAVDATTFLARFYNQRDTFDVVGASGGAQGLGPYVTATYYNCERPGWYSGYLDCEFDDLFVRASMTVDPQERDEVYGQAARMFNEALPQLPLWTPHDLHAATNRLGGGFTVHRDARRTFTNIETWTLD